MKSSNTQLVVTGAREHNLKNITVHIPRNAFVVVTGISGSGKSSLAFDTIYAEGQRRYIESLSAYARQFLDQLPKPDVEHIDGLSPAISIEQKGISKNPRSTVGTVTEIYDYLRLLFSNLGVPHCPNCGYAIQRQKPEQITERIFRLPANTRLLILAPVVRGRKGEYGRLFEQALRQGYVRAIVDGKLLELDQPIPLKKAYKHDISLVVDRVTVTPRLRLRITDAIQSALKKAEGLVELRVLNEKGQWEGEPLFFSERFSCPDCGFSISELAPRMFSFNSPYGACSHCKGLGYVMEPDEDLMVPDRSLPLREGALRPIAEYFTDGTAGDTFWQRKLVKQVKAFLRDHQLPRDKPYYQLPAAQRKLLLHGDREQQGSFPGLIQLLKEALEEVEYEDEEDEILSFYDERPCPQCKGRRLKPASLAVKFRDHDIYQLSQLSVKEAKSFFGSLHFTARERQIAQPILKEITDRIQFLDEVGLNYLTFDRRINTLAGGEAQRIRLATQVGTKLVGVLYVLDEPSIGLHQRDHRRLIQTLKQLRQLGNTIIVVEHDETTIRAADFVVDLGPGGGKQGGELVCADSPQKLIKCPESITGRYLGGLEKIEVPARRRPPNPDRSLQLLGAAQYNLKHIDVTIPLGLFICVTGVSGSGKSTLTIDILYNALARKLYKTSVKPGTHRALMGMEQIRRVFNVDQSPIGRTPRSNPATYIGVFTPIRELYEKLPEARRRGYRKGRFSFNVRGGRCEHCKGQGTIKVEMHFLPNVYVTCEQCHGRQYNRETLEVKYREKSIADVLEMTVAEALEFFSAFPQIKHKLQNLYDVGLGYITLGQSATTLSGGEAQRIKLTRELAKKSDGKTLYILDEPTTGLHFDDIKKLLGVINRLVDLGNTVIVIEHHLDVIKSADYLIDLGPEGGNEGGEVVALGTPEQVAQNQRSYTGHYLHPLLKL